MLFGKLHLGYAFYWWLLSSCSIINAWLTEWCWDGRPLPALSPQRTSDALLDWPLGAGSPPWPTSPLFSCLVSLFDWSLGWVLVVSQLFLLQTLKALETVLHCCPDYAFTIVRGLQRAARTSWLGFRSDIACECIFFTKACSLLNSVQSINLATSGLEAGRTLTLYHNLECHSDSFWKLLETRDFSVLYLIRLQKVLKLNLQHSAQKV